MQKPDIRPWTKSEVPVGSRIRMKSAHFMQNDITGTHDAEPFVLLRNRRVGLDELRSDWELMDGSPCGVENKPIGPLFSQRQTLSSGMMEWKREDDNNE